MAKKKQSRPSTEEIQKLWPLDVPFDMAICSKIQRDWVRLKMNGNHEILGPFIRIRVPTEHKGEFAIPMQPHTSTLDVSTVSVGPFSHDCGGGHRNIRKAENMS